MNSGMSIREKTKPWDPAMTNTCKAGIPPAKSILAAAARGPNSGRKQPHVGASETPGPLIRRFVVEHFLSINA